MKHLRLVAILICVLGAQAEPERTPRIINGHTAPGIVGYHAFIVYMNEEFGGFFGGGTIISDRHVLSSAKIIHGWFQWEIRVGSNVFVELERITIKSYHAISHPEFDFHTSVNDIGIIFLPESLVFTQNVYPVALPDLNLWTNLLPSENEEGTIVGFGYTNTTSTNHSDLLMRAFQRVNFDAGCEVLYENQSPQLYFCARDNAQFANMCLGDVGGGFVTFVRGRPTITGIVSYVREICGTAYPTGFTRVAYYRDWIRNVTQL